MPRLRLAYLVSLVLAGLLTPATGQQATVARPVSSTALGTQGRLPATTTGLQATATRFVTVQIITSTLGLSASSAPSSSDAASTSMSAATNGTLLSVSASTAAVTAGPVVLDTKVGPAFGILGAFLIISGLALATTGSAHRRLAVFIVTIYTWAIVTFVIILHFGVEQQVSVPSQGIRVAFLVASLAAGVIFGVATLIFHRGTKVIIAPVAGFLLGVVIQSLRNDGLIRQIGLRYFLYLGLTGLAFIIGIVPRCLDGSILASTAFLGALAFVIGVDCFSTANLKEFFVYNLGFSAIFPRLNNHFMITAPMQIELGVILLVFAISVAAQIRLYNLFEDKLSALMKRSDREKNANEEEKAANRITDVMNSDVEKFDHRYSRGFPFSVPMEQGSPSFSHASLQTPKSESAPLLPELNYVSTGNQNRRDLNADSKTSPLASPVMAAVGMDRKDSMELAQEIMDKEKALQEIALLRQKIGQQRDSLRPNSSGSESTTTESKVPFPEAAYRPPAEPLPKSPIQPGHRQTVSFNGIPATQSRRTSIPTAPRPISQHSLIITPAALTANQTAPATRPPNHHTISSPTIPTQPRRTSASSYANNTLTRHYRARSSGNFTSVPMMGRSPSNNTLPGTQRIITGTLPSRPSSQHIAQSGAMTRTQTMDITDLEARHRRRLSQLQGGARTSLVLPKSPVPEANNSQTQSESTRKRSSTMAGISQAERAAADKRQSRIDEFGRPVPAPPIKAANEVVAAKAPPSAAVPTPTNSVPAKKSASDWLSY